MLNLEIDDKDDGKANKYYHSLLIQVQINFLVKLQMIILYYLQIVIFTIINDVQL